MIRAWLLSLLLLGGGVGLAKGQSCTVDSCSSTSQQPQVPDAPTPRTSTSHSFLDPINLSEFAASATAISAEASMSCTNQTGPAQSELCRQVALGAVGTLALQLTVQTIAHKTGHHQFERLSGPTVILFHVGRMVWISTHRH